MNAVMTDCHLGNGRRFGDNHFDGLQGGSFASRLETEGSCLSVEEGLAAGCADNGEIFAAHNRTEIVVVGKFGLKGIEGGLDLGET